MRLTETLDLRAAAPLAADLLAARGTDITLDASAVRSVGAQCLQVLLSAQHVWAAEGHAFHIADASSEFVDGLALMGAVHLANAALVQD